VRVNEAAADMQSSVSSLQLWYMTLCLCFLNVRTETDATRHNFLIFLFFQLAVAVSNVRVLFCYSTNFMEW